MQGGTIIKEDVCLLEVEVKVATLKYRAHEFSVDLAATTKSLDKLLAELALAPSATQEGIGMIIIGYVFSHPWPAKIIKESRDRVSRQMQLCEKSVAAMNIQDSTIEPLMVLAALLRHNIHVPNLEVLFVAHGLS